ncbi:EAL domain-containing protein [Magnetospirillum sp. UT-4]|uniref:sensor domain-containing protein n=1 Tax=Magnetospirillum sp. UT-4 TaxID=2681467 RepID=UPI0013820B83|nr:EAL domain-containing protein [Magnetospirillum sp. UT-4]CAA7616567.1 Sensory box/GGDEF family protein [Magnetospirillum sp. UT-4]
MTTDPLPGPSFRALSDASEIGLVLLGHDGRIVVWNAWMAAASDIEPAVALGSTLDRVFPRLAGGRIVAAVEDALQSGLSAVLSSSLNKSLFPLTHQGLAPERGEPMHQIVVIKPLPAPTGGRACLVQVFDITTMAHREALLRQQARTMEALAENYRLSELHNRAIVDNTADAIVTFGEDGAIGTYNPAAEWIFGYGPQEIVGKPVGTLIPALGGADARLQADSLAAERREVTGRRKSGDDFPLELSVSAMEVGGQPYYVAVAHDITERKQAEQELKTQKEWLTTLINAMPDLVCFKDGDGRWLVANEFYRSIAGLSGIDYQGRTGPELARLSQGKADFLLATAETDQRAWANRAPIAYEKELSSPSGETRVFDVAKIPLFNPDGSRRGLVLVGRDITERRLAAARIHHLAHHDSLTGLPNRSLFQESLRVALAQARRVDHKVALLFLDLDKFKDINDTLGHHVGDLLLKAVAKRLLRCVRETDNVARLGGDEFAVLLTNLEDAEGAGTVAETIIASVADPFGIEEHEVLTSASIGITLFPDDAGDAEALLKNADLAMFRSKAEGRNGYHFYVAEMDAEVQARKQVERDLRLAMGTEQLELYYQPLVEVKTGEVMGCEALLRWKHPDHGFISPADFIPIAERTDLIAPLGRWILHRACLQGRDWARDGLPPMKIAVNLSPAQFKHHETLVAMVADILDQTGFPPDHLQLEITEGIAMQNVEATILVLRQMRDMGVLISIDDFGTGYSSLNYLKRFPVDKLKIDRSFVIDIGDHPCNAAVVKAIVNLGHSLGTRVNVEGVETREQLDFLISHGVDEAQGFYFAKALPADEFARLVREKSPYDLTEGIPAPIRGPRRRS